MNLTLEFGGDHPLSVNAVSADGFHRPLEGEAASVTVTVAHAALMPGWLDSPPLGLACEVVADGETVLAGVLHGARVWAGAVELMVES